MNTDLVIPEPSMDLVEEATEIMERVATLSENTCNRVPRHIKPVDIDFEHKKKAIEETIKVILLCLKKAHYQEEIERCRVASDRVQKVYERFETLDNLNKEREKLWKAEYGEEGGGKDRPSTSG